MIPGELKIEVGGAMIDPARLRAQIAELPTFIIKTWADYSTRNPDQLAVLLSDVLTLLEAPTDESPKQYFWRDKNVDELTHDEAIAALKRTIDTLQRERDWQTECAALDRDLAIAKRVLSQR